MAKHELTTGKDEFEIMIKGSLEYRGAEKILGDLSAEDACHRLEGSPHTIAELVYHLNFWQKDQLEILKGRDATYGDDFELGKSDFSAVNSEDWDALREEFIKSYDELIELCGDKELVGRSASEKYSVGFLLANHAIHNAYHFGQIMQIRRMMGNWVG